MNEKSQRNDYDRRRVERGRDANEPNGQKQQTIHRRNTFRRSFSRLPKTFTKNKNEKKKMVEQPWASNLRVARSRIIDQLS